MATLGFEPTVLVAGKLETTLGTPPNQSHAPFGGKPPVNPGLLVEPKMGRRCSCWTPARPLARCPSTCADSQILLVLGGSATWFHVCAHVFFLQSFPNHLAGQKAVDQRIFGSTGSKHTHLHIVFLLPRGQCSLQPEQGHDKIGSWWTSHRRFIYTNLSSGVPYSNS